MDVLLQEMLRSLKAALGSRFATYEVGRRDLVGESEMPYLCVYPRATRERRSGTGNDDAEYEIGVMAVLTARNSPNQPRTARASTQMDLVRAFEGRDADGKALPATVVGALNADITVGGKALWTDGMSIAYDSEFDGKGTRERASLVLTAHARPQR